MSQAIDELLRLKHHLHAEAVSRLDASSRDELIEIARGHRQADDRVKAIWILSAAGHPDTRALLREIVADANESPELRAVAIANLVDVEGVEAEEALIGLLRETLDPVVRLAIVRALGQVGTGPSIEALESIATEPDDEALGRQRDFAIALIAHREGRRDDRPEPPNADALPVGDDAVALEIERAPIEDVGAAIRDVGRSPYGVHVSPEASLEFQCQGSRGFILADAAVATGELPTMVRERPVMAGVIVRRSPEDGSYSVSRVAMASPRPDGGFALTIYRLDGRITHYGEGVVDKDTLRAEIRALDGPGSVPFEATIEVTRNEITLRGARSGRRITNRRHPTRSPDPSTIA